MAHAHAQTHFGAVKTDLLHPYYSFRLSARAALARTKKNKLSLRNGKLKACRASVTNERPRIRCVNKKTENHKNLRLATQKIEAR